MCLSADESEKVYDNIESNLPVAPLDPIPEFVEATSETEDVYAKYEKYFRETISDPAHMSSNP